jgi:2-polyprenyl-3-methyl-5-hydroxy-6-metoxy-1,4-benzoquinol methylase
MKPPQPVCPVCGNSDCAIVYDLTTVRSPEDVPGLVMRCRVCPTWFKLLTDPAGIPTAYPGEYGEDEVADGYLASPSARAFFQRTLANVRSASKGTKLRLLDIGAAQGALLEHAVRTGFDAEGIDHCESNARAARARGLRVRHMAAEDLADHETFDVITMLDIVEHLLDPVGVLRVVHRALKPDGELVVYTPNHRAAVVALAKLLHAMGIRQPVREIFGRNHVCFFDERSLALALKTAGFEIRLCQLFPYDPERPGQCISPLSLAAVTAAEWLGRPFHKVFRMLVYARKSGVPHHGNGAQEDGPHA